MFLWPNNSKVFRSILVAGCLMIGGILIVSMSTRAADHLDAPGLSSPGGDGRLDINDLYAFQSPDNPDNTVLIMTVNPLAGVLSGTTFHPEASYDFFIDRDGDAKGDIRYSVTFSQPDLNGLQEVLLRCVPSSRCASVRGAVLARGQTGEVIEVRAGGMLTAGVFDDPFFFDLNAFLGSNGRTFCDGDENDFFAGLNVSAIILEVPSANLGFSNIGVWARTELSDQVDRMGRPAINTVFIPSDFKTAFNEAKPRHDVRDFSAFLDPFAGLLLPDILTVDTSSAAGFLNGRRLDDDVIDIELGLIGVANGTDCVDANDQPFQAIFPYLAPAN